MTLYRVGQAADLLGVSADTVRRWAERGELATTRTEGGHRLVEGAELARFVTAQGGTRPPAAGAAQSARNRFTGIVTRVVRDRVTAQVEMQSGHHRVVSLMTREAADDLGLEPGVLAVAVVKSTSVVVEIPG